MDILTSVAPTQSLTASWRREGLRVGFVPTMGYLHAGHESLIRAAAAENDRVVVSIFVNPTQFGPNEDLEAYPRDWERDRGICRSLGVSLIFAPDAGEMYPGGFATKVGVRGLSEVLCGRSRPIHFDGVCLVCLKLFNVVGPDAAYFGLKDAQQYFVLARMVKDLNLNLTLRPCPIVREPDGLAMSSRNAYLSGPERKAALILSSALNKAREAAEGGEREASRLTGLVSEVVATEPLARLEYAQAVSTDDLSEVSEISGEVLVAAAVWVGKTRLIDNFILPPVGGAG